MKPQLENGYVKIASEILDALSRYRIPGEQRQCLDYIIRKTYGFHKKEDQIANSQFREGTGMDKANICRALRELSKKQLVIKNDNTNPPTYRFNKNYTEWLPLSKKTTVVNNATSVVKKDNKPLSKVTDTIDKKDTSQKIKYKESRKPSWKPERPDWFPEKDWDDLLAHRRAKKATNSERAMNILLEEFKKAKDAGLSIGGCVDLMVIKEWRGFKADWAINQTPKEKPYDPFAGAI